MASSGLTEQAIFQATADASKALETANTAKAEVEKQGIHIEYIKGGIDDIKQRLYTTDQLQKVFTDVVVQHEDRCNHLSNEDAIEVHRNLKVKREVELESKKTLAKEMSKYGVGLLGGIAIAIAKYMGWI